MEKREEKPMQICVAGVGAVGGLLAAMLGRRYPVNVIARGKRAEALRSRGIVLHSEFYGEQTCHPAAVAEDGAALGRQDFIIVTVKNYSLDEIAEKIRPAVGSGTVLLPVLNGVEAGDRLRALFPEAIVCDALIYTVTAANPDYSATQKGNYSYMFIGSKIREPENLAAARKACDLICAAGFDARYSEDIESEIWQKFVLNCAFNTVTARYLINTADIRKDPKLQEDLHALLTETYEMGIREGIRLPEDLVEQKFRHVMEKQSETATSSLRRDVEAGRKSELDTFLGAVLRLAEKHGCSAPVSARYYQELQEIENARAYGK